MTDYTAEEQQILDRIKSECEHANAEFPQVLANRLAPGARPVGSPGGHWRQPQARILRMVPPGEILTQYGTDYFRAQPRFEAHYIVEVALSMLLGDHDTAFAAQMVTRKPARANATVRRFRTSDLWLNGYRVLHTPSEFNPAHVSVYYGDIYEPAQRELARASWEDSNRVTLDALAILAGEAL